MSYLSLATLAEDILFLKRVAACAAEQKVQTNVYLEGLLPLEWAKKHIWLVSASPGFADAYQFALDSGVEYPGAAPDVITDAQLLSAVSEEISKIQHGP